MEKRAFTRRAVSLEGLCSAPGKGSQTVEIRDFCTGGMLLAYNEALVASAPQHGDVVDVRCDVPNGRASHSLRFHGRIVRVESGTAGLAFLDPDIESIHALHNFAKRSARSEPRHAEPKPAGTKASAILAECRQIAETRLELIIEEFLTLVSERLYRKASAAQRIVDKNTFYDAVNALQKHGGSFKNDFIRHIRRQLSTNSPTLAPSRQQSKKISARTLSLVEDDVFEEWLVFSDTARKVELEFQEELTDLALRLSALYGEAVDNETNPFAPASFTQAFKLALQSVVLAPDPARVVYAAFRDVLTARTGALYEKLNAVFAEHGLQIDVRGKYQIRRSATTQAKHSAPAASVMLASDSGAPPPQHSASAATDWYQLVQELEHLRKQVASPPPQEAHVSLAAPAATAQAAVVDERIDYIAPEALFAALSQINVSPNTASGKKTSIKSQMLTLLSAQRPGEKIALPEREEKIIDVTETLLDSVLNDKLVAASVTPWLRQLSIPLLKTAIRDESLFSDREHYTRQIVNAVAELEFYGDDASGQNAVARKIQALLQEIENADDATPELFQKVLRELNSLIRIQHKAYEENVREVVMLEQAKPAVAGTGASQVPAEDETTAEWQKRVRRLKIGNSIMLDADANPRRLKIAWIGKNFDRYVFVNVKGLKEQALHRDELVHRLRSGSAIVLDDGGEPLVDRAQYSMLQKMHRHLLHETTHDQLTGLINRRELERLLTEALADTRQHESHHVLCHFDLTQFNVVNSTFGYDAGDRVLLEVAELLEREIGAMGIVARIGGDEFAALFSHTTIADALGLTARLKAAFIDYRYTIAQQSLGLSFSAGLVSLLPESASAADVLQSAETSAHVARSKGSNYTKVFNADDTGLHRAQQVTRWVTRIDTALDSETLELRYQPIVGIADGGFQIHHAEILLGVRDEAGNPVSPTEFILAAEHYRRMATVDRWVIEHAFRWMRERSDQVPLVGGLAINLSGTSLNEEGFVEYILEQAKKYAPPMDKVCFEITETAGIENLSNASEFILAVKKTGCMFALDDFGSGHSSYAYLKNLPVDFLKIDGAFVRHMDENPYDFAVVKSITEIGHFMGKKIIAEFVENEGILQMLRDVGVDFAQGYVIAKPQSLLAL